jgi:hypothetical protein
MARAIVGLCTVELELLSVETLREKRAVLKTLLTKLHSTYNTAAAEIDFQDDTTIAVLAFVVVSNASAHADQMINSIVNFLEKYDDDVELVQHTVEIL